MKTYPVQKIGNLFLVRASIGRLNTRPSVLKLLVDTGASQTTIPVSLLTDIGYSIEGNEPRTAILTGNEVIQTPLVNILWLSCLGQRVENFPVLALDLPSRYINGVLGMDFLIQFNAVINVGKGEILIP